LIEMHASTTIAMAPRAHTTRGPRAGLRAGASPRAAQRRAIGLRSETEIGRIRSAGELAARALAAGCAASVPGATTAEIDRAVRAEIEAGGGEPLFLGYVGKPGRPAFPAVSCISVNDELVHGVPGARVICDGDLVSIDVGVRLDGWCADTATTVAVGDVGEDRRAMLRCAERMLAHAIEGIVPGRRWSSIAAELEAMAVAEGFAIAVDFVGHGIGRELHEAPQVPCALSDAFLSHQDFTLRPGMVLAVEPMLVLEQPVRDSADGHLLAPRGTLASDGWTVTLDSGAASCQVEHTIAVTRDGARVLTARGADGVQWRRAG
jgi:methionyl aminopeptidase